mmetsp:Transcript_1896/g.7930  ORF Transcript_1896/g.7930 Transcript_1896/m.7930 type:complete len:223 (+) Transcript_1896:388-1056(+)
MVLATVALLRSMMASVSLILSRPYTRSSSVCMPCSSISPGATISDCADDAAAAAAAPPPEPFENFENLDPPPAPPASAPGPMEGMDPDDVDAAPDDEKGFCFSRSAASLAAAKGSGLRSPGLAPGAGDAPAAASSCSCLAAMSACAAFFRWTKSFSCLTISRLRCAVCSGSTEGSSWLTRSNSLMRDFDSAIFLVRVLTNAVASAGSPSSFFLSASPASIWP